MSALLTLALVAATRQSTPIVVDVTQQTPISPYIYGGNFPNWAKLQTSFPLARLGGNRMTAYNWENNASNAGNDYRNQNDGYMGETYEPGWTLKNFLDGAQSHGAAALITVPTAGYVAADKGPENDVNLTPHYLKLRFFRTSAHKSARKYDYPPNLKDRVVYMDEMVAYLEKVKSAKTPVWYALDNEPDIWHSTHSRIVPKPFGYAEIIRNNIDFATGIKAAAPKAKVFGPANYGWQGFRTFQDAPDARGRDFLDVYLTAMRKAEMAKGKRLLDVLDIHWYPEAKGDGVRVVTEEDRPGIASARIQAARSLWDPTYVEDSWIADSLGKKPIVLIPNLLKQIDKNYPGTKLAITEYDFGGGKAPSGMVAEADVLGVFGRYGVWAATHWGISDNRPATLAGMRAFLAFDGKAAFGDIGLGVKGENPAQESLYASRDSKNPNRFVFVLINKQTTPLSRSVRIDGLKSGTTRAFLANPEDPLHPKATKAQFGAGTLAVDLPPLSVMTVEITRK